MSRTDDEDLIREFQKQWHELRNQSTGIEIRSVAAESGYIDVVYTRPGRKEVFGLRRKGPDRETLQLWGYLVVWDVIEPPGSTVQIQDGVLWRGDALHGSD